MIASRPGYGFLQMLKHDPVGFVEHGGIGIAGGRKQRAARADFCCFFQMGLSPVFYLI
jgi:hypothetical protein